MFFERKNIKLAKRVNKELIETVKDLKKEYYMKKSIIENSIEPSQTIIRENKILEAKYFFFIKQLKLRKIRTENHM
jgi:hypothetical protein